MMLSVFKVAEVKARLKEDPTCIVIAPDFDGQVELILAGIPKDSVKILLSVMSTDNKNFLIMPRSQYDYYRREEEKIIAVAERGAASGKQDRDT